MVDSAGVAMGSGSDSLEREPFFSHGFSKSFIDLMMDDPDTAANAKSRGDLEKKFAKEVILGLGGSGKTDEYEDDELHKEDMMGQGKLSSLLFQSMRGKGSGGLVPSRQAWFVFVVEHLDTFYDLNEVRGL